LGEGLLGIISPETTPLVSEALYRAAEWGVRLLVGRFGLETAIKLLQPYLKNEDEQIKILVMTWYYP